KSWFHGGNLCDSIESAKQVSVVQGCSGNRMRSCLLFSSRLVSFQSGVENLLCDKKGSLLQFCNCGRQLDESLLRRKLEDCDGKYIPSWRAAARPSISSMRTASTRRSRAS